MSPVDHATSVAPDDGSDRVLEALEESETGMLAVMESGELLGVITAESAMRR